MKKTQFIDAIKNIQKRWASFLSVVLIIAIGTGGFFTTRNVVKSFSDSFETLYDETNFKNYDLVSSGGIVDADIEEIKKTEGIDEAEGVILLNGELSFNNHYYNVQVISITDKVSVPVVIDGKLPTSPSQILINEDLCLESGIRTGDIVTLRNTSNLEENPLKNEKYIVSGIMRHPEYIRYTLQMAVALPESSFNMEALNDSYTNAFVTGDENAIDNLWQLLPTLSSNTKTRIDATAEEKISEKTEEVNKQLEEAETELSKQEKDAMRQLSDAEKQIKEYEALFINGQKQIEDGRKQLSSAYNRLIKGEKELEEGKAQLEKAKQAYKELNEIFEAIRKITGRDITPDEILQYLNTANHYINKLENAIKNNDNVSINLEQLLDYLANEDLRKILEQYSKTSDVINKIIDIDLIKQTTEKIRQQALIIIDENNLDSIRFRNYFTEDGLNEFLNNLKELIKVLQTALKEGTSDDIAKAKQDLRDFFGDHGSQVISDLLKEYTGKDLKEIIAFINSSNDTLLNVIDILEQSVAYLEDEEYLRSDIKNTLVQIIDLTKQLYDATIEQNKEKIDAARKNLFDFLDKEEVKEIIDLIDEITEGTDSPFEDLKGTIEVLRIIDQVSEGDLLNFLGIFNMAKDYVEDEEFLKTIDVEAIINILNEAITQLQKAADLGDIDYETLAHTLDFILTDEGAEFINMIIKFKTGVDIKDIINKLDSYIEIPFIQLSDYIDMLINDQRVSETYSRIYNTMMQIDQIADGIITSLDNMDTSALADNIIMLIDLLSQSDFDFAKKLILDYFDYNFDFRISDFISLQNLNEANNLVNEFINYVKTYKTLPDQIAEGNKRISQGRQELKDGWRAYNAGIKELEKNESLLNSSAAEIASARKQLNDKKAEAISKLEEAKEELSKARKTAQDEIKNAREDILSRKYNWIMRDRLTNASYMDATGTLDGVQSSSKAFGTLFLLAISLVCFSTIAMIVEEEKRSVGTTKAFGFYNREIFNKYLLFGVSAGVIGCLLGVAFSYLLSSIVIGNMNSAHMYNIGKMTVKNEPLVILLTSLFIIALTVITTFVACTDLLKTPAAILMKGETISSRNRKNRKKDTTGNSKRSLYSRLIIRNIINEKERVMITVLIIALSCFIVGVGITTRDSFFGMIAKEKEDVMIYDFRVEYNSETTDKELRNIENVLEHNNTNYLNAYYGGHLFSSDKVINGVYVIAADNDKLHDFIAVKDLKTHEDIPLPSDGILIQNRLSERFNLNTSDVMTLYDSNLETHEATIKGVFANYQGRYVITSDEAYEKLFGKEIENNCYYVKLNGANYNDLYDQLTLLSDNIAIERADSYMSRLNSSMGIYNILVVIMTSLAILMSFMILTNLSNIFIARKKKELIIMRINGFTISQTINYLARETILTTLIGVTVAVVLGLLLSTPMIRMFEHTDTMFIRGFNIRAWAIAVALECLFSFIINYIVFRKVKKLNFREI